MIVDYASRYTPALSPYRHSPGTPCRLPVRDSERYADPGYITRLPPWGRVRPADLGAQP
jgi:hypothetical protein